MKTIIDHAIQMPAPPSFVWQRIGNLQNNPAWQINCQAVTYVTGIHSGVGTRWRSTSAKGRDSVLEITAWYENMGYEYKIVDGGVFSQARGRLRLQEIAEGTVVQWTFTYDISGLMGGLRNGLSLRRKIDSQMVESLRKLYRLIKEQGGRIELESVKSLMREAPGYEQRQGYRPRYPSSLEAELSIKPEPTASLTDQPLSLSSSPFNFPPPIDVEDDDTRPNPAVQASPRVPMPTEVLETQVDAAPLAGSASLGADPSFLSRVPSPPAPSLVSPPPAFEAPPPPPYLTETEALKPYEAPMILPALQAKPPTTEAPRVESPISAALETREVSVFDLFGVPRPSKTQEMRAIALEAASAPPNPKPPAEPLANLPDQATSALPRTGYRWRARQHFPRLRKPL